ncbi:MAG: hypothetical protein ABIN08_04955 [Caldimonas sp.]
MPTLGQFKTDLKGLLRALPLLGVALVVGLLIAALGYVLASIERLWRWITPNPFMAEIVATLVRFLSVVLGLVAALQVLGATALLGTVLGGAGVIGIALGFAVRDTVDNYVSSLMLSLRQPFRANDHVVIASCSMRRRLQRLSKTSVTRTFCCASTAGSTRPTPTSARRAALPSRRPRRRWNPQASRFRSRSIACASTRALSSHCATWQGPRRLGPQLKRSGSGTTAASGDTSPDKHIERLVAEERRANTGKNDLLDSAKPTE